MCGIVGLLALRDGAAPERGALVAMTRALSHRGPDDEGFAELGAAALGHRRLRVIDLEGGAQPMFNEDRSVAVVFNGEIYNFQELRPALEIAGHRFATHSDTEIILHAYEEKGVECLADFNGMFAFALWDSRRRRLFCARDRMGQKPLYYAAVGGQLAVASELKALLLHPAMRRQIDPRALSAFLAFEYVPSPMCIVKNAAKLAAGHYFTVDLDHPPVDTADIRQIPYWDIPFDPRERPDEELCAELTEHLKKAVERRLIADVPLGVFLSGGIDSTSIVAMMSELRPAKEIKTFTIRFEEATFDESAWARSAADHFGVEHHEESMPASRVLDVLPRVIEVLDEPFADPSMLPAYLLCEFTRKHVTVALGGDGGDELFAGYDPFQAHSVGKWASLAPGWARRAFRAAAGLAPVSDKNVSLPFIVKHFLGGLDYSPPRRHWAWMGSFPPEWQREILSPDVLRVIDPDDCYAAADAHWARRPNADELHKVIYQYCKLYLQDDILTKVDRASMAHGLEARAPMLDPRFVEWAGTVPSDRKLNGRARKYIFKKAMRGRVPDDIIQRRKKGFGMPVAQWFRGPLKSHMEDRLSDRSFSGLGLLNPAAARRVFEDHLARRADNRKELWTLLMLIEWGRKYLG